MGKYYQNVTVKHQDQTMVRLDCHWEEVKNILETPHGAKCIVVSGNNVYYVYKRCNAVILYSIYHQDSILNTLNTKTMCIAVTRTTTQQNYYFSYSEVAL